MQDNDKVMVHHYFSVCYMGSVDAVNATVGGQLANTLVNLSFHFPLSLTQSYIDPHQAYKSLFRFTNPY